MLNAKIIKYLIILLIPVFALGFCLSGCIRVYPEGQREVGMEEPPPEEHFEEPPPEEPPPEEPKIPSMEVLKERAYNTALQYCEQKWPGEVFLPYNKSRYVTHMGDYKFSCQVDKGQEGSCAMCEVQYDVDTDNFSFVK